MAARPVIPVDQLSDDALREELHRVNVPGGGSPGNRRRLGAVQKEIARRETKQKNAAARASRKVQAAQESREAQAPHKRERTLNREHVALAKAVGRGVSRTTRTDEYGNRIEVETRDDSPRAKARRYPGVYAAYSRVLELDKDIQRLENKGAAAGRWSGARFIPHLAPDDQRRYEEIKERRRRAYAQFVDKLSAAEAIEKKKAAAEKKKQPKTAPFLPRASKSKKKKPSGPTVTGALIEAQRAYQEHPSAANLLRVRKAQRAYQEANPSTVTPPTPVQKAAIELARLQRREANLERGRKLARQKSQRKPKANGRKMHRYDTEQVARSSRREIARRATGNRY